MYVLAGGETGATGQPEVFAQLKAYFFQLEPPIDFVCNDCVVARRSANVTVKGHNFSCMKNIFNLLYIKWHAACISSKLVYARRPAFG